MRSGGLQFAILKAPGGMEHSTTASSVNYSYVRPASLKPLLSQTRAAYQVPNRGVG
ncbi:Glutamate dehydrogenase/leucine dehydrogenase [Pseudomonas syringae pv. actinidiae]|uniref:Glutamate dehydrogenase/leucine dehydrogenase n=1 Tax=Pseudomonas syringae pv. actinidiae TaxID=103796 RepID=A0A2V0QRX5_PSESF|nr:Glutamate dehydrogenase/leucine dehydrogenase [Pseudomonas syringae pv. actinidiae]